MNSMHHQISDVQCSIVDATVNAHRLDQIAGLFRGTHREATQLGHSVTTAALVTATLFSVLSINLQMSQD
jgi:hypothetical protein